MPDMASTRYVTYDIPSFKSEMKQLCPGCTVIADDANGDPSLQRQQATAAISQGAKAIVVDPVDAASAAAWINQAMSQGIKVIAYDRPIAALKVNYYVSFDNERVGQMIATAELAHLEATGTLSAPGGGILIVNGSPTDAAAGLIKKGVHDIVDPSGVKVLAEYDTPDWVPAKAQAWVSSQITRFGSKIKGIIAANDGTGTAAVAALEAAGVSPFPPVTGNDATLAGTQLVLTGKMWVSISKPGPDRSRCRRPRGRRAAAESERAAPAGRQAGDPVRHRLAAVQPDADHAAGCAGRPRDKGIPSGEPDLHEHVRH